MLFAVHIYLGKKYKKDQLNNKPLSFQGERRVIAKKFFKKDMPKYYYPVVLIILLSILLVFGAEKLSIYTELDRSISYLVWVVIGIIIYFLAMK